MVLYIINYFKCYALKNYSFLEHKYLKSYFFSKLNWSEGSEMCKNIALKKKHC